MVSSLQVKEEETHFIIQGYPDARNHYRIGLDKITGKICRIALYDGIEWNEILTHGCTAGDNWELPVQKCIIEEKEEDYIKLLVVRESVTWHMEEYYEFFARGYVVCSFSLKALHNQADAGLLTTGISMDETAVFSHKHRILNMTNNLDDWLAIRALSVDFSTDDRPVTNSINFLLETVTDNMQGLPCGKVYSNHEGYRYLGWQLSRQNSYPFPEGYEYKNRWALTLTGQDNGPNMVRAQRIYHYYGYHPQYPQDDLLNEMSEYGCSILALHTPFAHISGSRPSDEDEMARVVKCSHELGIKVIFYCQPYLLSLESPYYKKYAGCRTECLRVWHSMKETQIVHYRPNASYDCDELCLRCNSAFDFIYSTVMDCWKKYKFDGLYIDFAWPSHGLCNTEDHGHKRGLFDFYDYWRILRKWRKAIGPNSIMIGHGGGLLVSSDFIEAFDACLTGEAQKELDPVIIGQQFGVAPALWAMHRRKQDIFRSPKTIEQLIREGMTPHNGLGIMGTSIMATVDPAHHVSLIALWQMWRGFPVNRSTFYNYLTEKVIEMDNKEVFYSLYITENKHVLLILVNAGGQVHDSFPAVGVNVRVDIKRLKLPVKMNCWRMKGNTYETFRVSQVDPVKNGRISVPELMLHEFIGFILSPDEPPEELIRLIDHLDGRWERLPAIMSAKQKRLHELDRMLDSFAVLPNAAVKIMHEAFMKDRSAE